MSSEDLKSLIVTDPDLVDPELDVSGLRTQTDTDPRLLASIADYPGISYDPTQFSYLTDLNELFAYGLPEIDTSGAVTPPDTTTPDTTTPDTGGGGQATLPGFDVDSPKNTPEEQRLIDAGIGVQGAPGDPVVAPGEIPVTQEEIDAFNQTPVTPVSPPGQPIDPTGMLPQTSTPFMVEGALGVDPREKMDFITEEDAADPTFLERIGLGQFNPLEAAVKAAINLAIGKPVTFLIDILTKNLPPQDPRQTALNEFYSTGAGAQYINPNSPNYIPGMENYNIVSGSDTLNKLTGDRLIDETTYGLQEAYQDRIDTIENTLKNKYGMTAAEIADVKAGTYKGDVQTDLLERLVNLEDAKEKEKNVLDLYSGDIDERDQMLEDIVLQNKIDAGIQAADDDKDDNMLDTSTGDGPVGVDAGSANIQDFSDIQPEVDEFSDEEFMVGDTSTAAPVTGGGGVDSFFDAVDTKSGDGPAGVDAGSASVQDFDDYGTYDPSPQSTYDAEEEDEIGEDRGGGNNGGNQDSGGGGCCFIMLEARYGDGTMDKVVRRYRDENMTPRNRRGYHKVAEVLVPLMRKSKIFKWIVTKTFADPLVSYGKWYYGENKHGWIFAPIKSAWLKLFDVVGTDTVFIRENGEEV